MNLTLRALKKALREATDDGSLDEVAAEVAHPSVVNQFCDAVEAALIRSMTEEELKAEMESYL